MGLSATLLVDAFLVPCLAHDLATLRRVHPAYFLALPLIALDQIVQAMVVTWPPWIELAGWLQRLVR